MHQCCNKCIEQYKAFRHYIILNIIIIGIPKYLRSDYGTENCAVASIHIAFHLAANTGLCNKSYIYGPSNRNVVSIVNPILSMKYNNA